MALRRPRSDATEFGGSAGHAALDHCEAWAGAAGGRRRGEGRGNAGVDDNDDDKRR